DVRKWREDREPRAGDEIYNPGPDATPLVSPFACAEGRVNEGHRDVEIGPKAIHEGQRQRDLRHEDERRPAGLEARRDRLDVDSRLAGARDAVEEQRRRVTGGDGGPDRVDGGRLLWQEIGAGG